MDHCKPHTLSHAVLHLPECNLNNWDHKHCSLTDISLMDENARENHRLVAYTEGYTMTLEVQKHLSVFQSSAAVVSKMCGLTVCC